MNDTSLTFHARGMHCHGCERVIESALRKLDGVKSAKANYADETVSINYDPQLTKFDAIRASVEANGYQVSRERPQGPALIARIALTAAALAGLAALILFDTKWISAEGEPNIAQHMSLGLIFLLGLITGFHCIGMCGGFVVSYVAADAGAGRSPTLSHIAYGTGKTLSYTAIGAAFGGLGAFIAFTPLLRGAAGVFAGAFLIIFGLNMLGLFAPLRRFRLGLPAPVQNWIRHEAGGRRQPFVIGLLNGLMIACGPLQAMYVMAAGTGSPWEGAQMLAAFGLGTLPVMLAFGALASVLSATVTHRLLRASGFIVVALGAVMINRGLILTGWGVDLASLIATWRRQDVVTVVPQQSAQAVQVIEMEANRFGYKPKRFTLIRGTPVKWVINATEITTCNNRILVPSLDLEFDLKPGRQSIEFTPQKAGLIPWSCWMGMMRGEFDVVEAEEPAKAPPPSQQPVAEASPVLATPAPQTHSVARGDTLSSIARKIYGDERKWRDIAAANPGLNARRLRPGQILVLPHDGTP